MGCDIHLFTERRNGPGAPWVLFPLSLKCGDCQLYAKHQGRECPFCCGQGTVIGYPERNYKLFSMLADVCNRSNDPLPVLIGKRGWPVDMSYELRSAVDGDLSTQERFNELPGDHSASWATLAELQRHTEKLRLASNYFVDELMSELARYGAPDDVRIVFNFDN